MGPLLSGVMRSMPCVTTRLTRQALLMPLARHKEESRGISAPSDYPTSCWDVEYGHVGWSVQDPQPGEMRILCRTPLANGLLAIAAV